MFVSTLSGELLAAPDVFSGRNQQKALTALSAADVDWEWVWRDDGIATTHSPEARIKPREPLLHLDEHF